MKKIKKYLLSTACIMILCFGLMTVQAATMQKFSNINVVQNKTVLTPYLKASNNYYCNYVTVEGVANGDTVDVTLEYKTPNGDTGAMGSKRTIKVGKGNYDVISFDPGHSHLCYGSTTSQGRKQTQSVLCKKFEGKEYCAMDGYSYRLKFYNGSWFGGTAELNGYIEFIYLS